MKDKSIIPEGLYCYSYTGETKIYKGYKYPKTKPCPYFKYVNGEAFCDFLKVDDYLLEDQVKICGVNENY